jgi:uncharacterized protein YdaL
MRLWLVLVLLCAASAQAADAPAALRVCVYFDGEDNAPGFTVGERSAVMVRNLLGHFAEVRVAMAAVSRYGKGELSACDRAIYTGTYADGKMPSAFLLDAMHYRKPQLWMNFNIWKLQQAMGRERFRAAWGFTYEKVDEVPTKRGEIPRFYSTFLYKGATFRKVSGLDEEGEFLGEPGIVIVKKSSAEVLSEAVHSATGRKTPYVLRHGDRFYIADNPTSVIDERDRYLIFADLLFDFLGLPPRDEKRRALVRIEDIDPGYFLPPLYQTIDFLKARHVPFALTLIPRHVDEKRRFDATERPKFVAAIRYAIANGGSILVHGYEHQLGVDLGCGVSYSGEGFEFWDDCKGRPLPFESRAFVQERLDKAKKILADAKIPFVGWVTPHYAASPLALHVIHDNFGRILQRMTYYVEGRPVTPANAIDQFYPYTIESDYYGFHVWPENLGYVPLPEHGGTPQRIDEMLAAARLNKVVRDGWASFFWHPALIETPLGLESLQKLVDGIRAEGYEFVSLRDLRARGE